MEFFKDVFWSSKYFGMVFQSTDIIFKQFRITFETNKIIVHHFEKFDFGYVCIRGGVSISYGSKSEKVQTFFSTKKCALSVGTIHGLHLSGFVRKIEIENFDFRFRPEIRQISKIRKCHSIGHVKKSLKTKNHLKIFTTMPGAIF